MAEKALQNMKKTSYLLKTLTFPSLSEIYSLYPNIRDKWLGI